MTATIRVSLYGQEYDVDVSGLTVTIGAPTVEPPPVVDPVPPVDPPPVRDPPPVVKPPVEPPPATPPPVTSEPKPLNAAFNCTVTGPVLYVNDFSTGAVSERWDFGDGSTSDAMGKQTHTYAASGRYVTKLTATAADGTTDTRSVVNGVVVPMAPAVIPEPSLAGLPVTVTHNGVALSLVPGERKPFVPGNPSGGSAKYYADGLCVVIENRYAGTLADLPGTFTVAAGGVEVWSGDMVIWAGGATRPFWLAQPKPLTNPDMSGLPKLEGGATASMAEWYAKGDNGPMGLGNILLAIGTGGEWPHLGPVPQWDACYLTNPSPENLAVVRGMADACAPVPVGWLDIDTGDMLDVRKYPKASWLDVQRGLPGNPIAKYATNCPMMLDQAQAHATNYGAVACAVFGTEFDKEQAALWCNWIDCLTINYSYRTPLGCCVYRNSAQRACGRGMVVLLNAAKHATGWRKDLFQSWVDEAAQEAIDKWVNQPEGIHIMRANGYANHEYAPWMQHLLVYGVGLAIQHGNTAFQPTLDYFADMIFQAVEADHEFATLYNAAYLQLDAKTPVADWAEGLRVKASYNSKFRTALAAPEDSKERQAYVNWSKSAAGYTAIYQAALAMCVRYATDQARAQAAWARFRKYAAVDYDAGSGNPKYNVIP